MSVIGAVAYGSFSIPGLTYTREFYDSFPTTGPGLGAPYTPEYPGDIYWVANDSAFTRVAHANMSPDLGPMVEGAVQTYKGVVIDHGIGGAYRIRIYVGVRGTTGKNSDLEFGVILRGASTVANSELDNCWVLKYKRKAAAGTENDSTIQFERYAGTPGTAVESSTETTCVGIDNLTGNWREIIIDDIGGSLTAYYTDAPSYTTSIETSSLEGNTVVGFCSLATNSNPTNYLRNDFEVLSIV